MHSKFQLSLIVDQGFHMGIFVVTIMVQVFDYARKRLSYYQIDQTKERLWYTQCNICKYKLFVGCQKGRRAPAILSLISFGIAFSRVIWIAKISFNHSWTFHKGSTMCFIFPEASIISTTSSITLKIEAKRNLLRQTLSPMWKNWERLQQYIGIGRAWVQSKCDEI